MSADGGERTERKLMAILAADVVGYSRLMGEDEEGTLAALKAVRREVTDPKIKEHRGRIVKTLGDGLLVEFPSVVDAVRCAVEMQREMAVRNLGAAGDKRIAFRIGINLGDIIIDDTDIFGDGVNVAARLEGLAEPGGICVSRVVRDQVRDKLGFGFQDLGQRVVKNIARPVHIYRVSLDGGAPAIDAAPPDANGSLGVGGPPRPRGRGIRPAIAVAGVLAVAVAGGISFGLWSGAGRIAVFRGATGAPIIGDPLRFEKNQVVFAGSTSAAIAQQAEFLRGNPNLKVAIEAYCPADEGRREGPWVLAQLRANRVRDALRRLGIAGNRIRTEIDCKADGSAGPQIRNGSAPQGGQVVVVQN